MDSDLAQKIAQALSRKIWECGEKLGLTAQEVMTIREIVEHPQIAADVLDLNRQTEAIQRSRRRNAASSIDYPQPIDFFRLLKEKPDSTIKLMGFVHEALKRQRSNAITVTLRTVYCRVIDIKKGPAPEGGQYVELGELTGKQSGKLVNLFDDERVYIPVAALKREQLVPLVKKRTGLTVTVAAVEKAKQRIRKDRT